MLEPARAWTPLATSALQRAMDRSMSLPAEGVCWSTLASQDISDVMCAGTGPNGVAKLMEFCQVRLSLVNGPSDASALAMRARLEVSWPLSTNSPRQATVADPQCGRVSALRQHAPGCTKRFAPSTVLTSIPTTSFSHSILHSLCIHFVSRCLYFRLDSKYSTPKKTQWIHRHRLEVWSLEAAAARTTKEFSKDCWQFIATIIGKRVLRVETGREGPHFSRSCICVACCMGRASGMRIGSESKDVTQTHTPKAFRFYMLTTMS